MLALTFLLAACFDGLGGSGGFMSFGGSARGAAPRTAEVAGGAVTIAGPRGYCIDVQATREETRGAVALLGGCDALGEGGRAPDTRAVLTASVSGPENDWPRVADSIDALTAFFDSAPGRAALSRSGQAGSVEVDSIDSRDGILLLRARDTSEFRGPSVAPDYWRAIFDLRGRVVTLSVMSAAGTPLSDQAGRGLIEAFVRAMMRANTG
ncbi:cation transport ATPase [Rhodobacteraceae bacterium WD3A24]|nr:cation transport ATPase [Rhodobacteraceae bacterium WD3A24]